ncbi:lantibiotic dehydratase [Streptomyces torulosus]|uniref:lantibiotic dehydratase n=1 Tax=Streptomyces torulosus TaxID=68276 RepID=UPI0006EBB393|nr:lantibiotic dehydratase [Streptomyces torulosus]
MRDGHHTHYTPQDCLFLRISAVPRTRRTGRPLGDSAEQVREAAARPLFREALAVASGSLADSLDRLDAGADPGAKSLRRTALAVTRYALRAETRPTPFGLFAGVTPGRAADTTKVRMAGPGRKAVRLDAAWLTRRVTEWLALPEVRRDVDVVLSDLCRTRGDRLVVPGNGSETSVRDTPLVSWVRERATLPVTYAALLEQAVEAFPRFGPDQVDAALFQMVRHGFLLTSITPQDLDESLFDRIAAALAPVPEAAEELRSLRAALDDYAATPPGEGHAAWRGLMRLTDPERTAARPPVHVDLRMDADVQLSRAVTEEAARYASAMWELSAEWLTHAHMRAYRDRFLEEYGTTGVVPLGRLVDQHRGIGFPPGYGERGDAPSPERRDAEALPKERRLLTHDLVQEALHSGDAEVRLTPGLVEQLAAGRTTDAAVTPPRSLELCFQLLAESGEAIDRGDFRLVSPAYPGSWVAGATFGRFAELTGMEGELRSLLAGLGDAGTVPAQVVFRPRTERALNMAQVPRLLPYRIPVGVHADRSAPGTLDWRQLLVTPDASGLRLVLPDDGREVLPIVPHMVALDREAPAVARLLVDLAFGRARTWTGWNWCGLEALPYLPRVTYGRVTIFPRRWVPDRHLRAAADSRAGAGDRTSGWDDAVEAWRVRYGVPDEVNLARWDRTYRVDLTDRWHREVFRQEVRQGGSLAIMEDLTDDGRALGWTGGHSAEVVIPLTRTTAPAPAAPQPHDGGVSDGVRRAPRHQAARPAHTSVPERRPTDHGVRHLPGEEWLYAKFYAVEDTHDEFLHACLPTLLRAVGDDVRSWHFVRYRDPDSHVRLRLHGTAEALRTTVLPRLAAVSRDWQEAGVIRTVVLDTYRPETDRYGGPDELPHAERMFCVDSRSALAQLTMRARGRLTLPDPVLAAVNHALLLESLGDWDWSGWISRVIPKGPAHTAYRRHQDLARSLIVPGRTAESAASALGAPLADLWTGTPETRTYGALVLSDEEGTPGTGGHAEAVLSLLHMQHNRLLGIDRAAEDIGYAVLRGVARDHQGRLAHARDEEQTG